MGKISLILVFLFFTFNTVIAQGDQNVSTFSNLQTLTLKNGIIVHYPKTGTNIINKYCMDLPKNDPFYINPEDYDDSRIIVLQMKIGEKDPQSLTVLYSDGPSDDPEFIFANSNGEQIESLGGLELYLPGNGYVYTTGHTNTSFNKRSKYLFNGSKFTEVKQPFYYVGLKTQTTKPITLYADKSQKEVVGSVPVDTEVEVLLAEYSQNFGGTEYFLVKTPFGLVGWIGFATYNLVEGTPFKGIYFAGD